MLCTSHTEIKLLADASNLMEKSRNCKRKEEYIKAVTAGLRSLGYDASICISRWKKTSSVAAGRILLSASHLSLGSPFDSRSIG